MGEVRDINSFRPQDKPKKKRRLRKKTYDFHLLTVTVLLTLIGIVMIFSSSWPEGVYNQNNGYFFFIKQFKIAIFGFFIMWLASKINYKFWAKWSLPLYLLSLFLGVLLFTSLGVERNHATRWLMLGPIQFMPSDVIKVSSIIFLSDRLSKKESIDKLKDLLPMILIVMVSCGLIIARKDLSTAIALGVSLGSILFVAGLKWKYTITFLIGAVILAYLYINKDGSTGFRAKRIDSFKDPFKDLQGKGWQAAQSIMALAVGGIFGSGLGRSRQKFFYIPEAHTDFIFAIIGEEFGLIGALIILLLFAVLIIRGVRIAAFAKDKLGRYMATGITALIAIQVIINVGVVIGTVPPTGITLPFISYGGTSLLINLGSIGILLNISKTMRKPNKKLKE